MLILDRHVGRSIKIGDNISVTILRIKGNQVTIGTDAPKNISVDREEIYERKKQGLLPPKQQSKP